MSSYAASGELWVEYSRRYHDALVSIRSPVLDTHTVAVPIPTRTTLGVVNQQPTLAGFGLQSWYAVLSVDDPEVRPMVCRVHWIDAQECIVVAGGMHGKGKTAGEALFLFPDGLKPNPKQE